MPQCIYYGTKIVNNNENVFSKNIIKLISDEKISIKTIIPSALLLSGWRTAIPFVLVSLLTLTTACSNDDNGDTNNEPMLKGKISSYNEFGAAMLDFTDLHRGGGRVDAQHRPPDTHLADEWCARTVQGNRPRRVHRLRHRVHLHECRSHAARDTGKIQHPCALRIPQWAWRRESAAGHGCSCHHRRPPRRCYPAIQHRRCSA